LHLLPQDQYFFQQLQVESASLRSIGFAGALVAPAAAVNEIVEVPEASITKEAEEEEEEEEEEPDEAIPAPRRAAIMDVDIGIVCKTGKGAASRLVHVNPTDASGWLEMGLTLHASALESGKGGDFNKAVRMLLQALATLDEAAATASGKAQHNKFELGKIDAKLSLADCLIRRREASGSEDALRLLVEVREATAVATPEILAEVERLSGRLLIGRGSIDDALRHYKEAVRLAPYDSMMWEEMAFVHFNTATTCPGAAQAGELCLQSALLFLPTAGRSAQEWRLRLRLARHHFYCKSYVPALKAVVEAIDIMEATGQPSCAAYFLQGLIYRKSRKWKEAMSSFTRALESHGGVEKSKPTWSDARVDVGAGVLSYLNVAQIKIREKELEAAESVLFKAEHLFPGLIPIQHHLDIVKSQLEQKAS
jgi:tetratricopeptide (TPR) repeat protein